MHQSSLLPGLHAVAHLAERQAREGRREPPDEPFERRAPRSRHLVALAAVHADDGRRRRGRPGQPQLGAGREPGRRVRRHPATLPSDADVPRRPPRFVIVIAHRGASAELPENTLPALERAIEIGADAIEIDVRADRDGRLVLTHDPVVRGASYAVLEEAVDLCRRSDPADGGAEDAAAVSPVRRRRAHGAPARSRRRGRVLPARRVTGGARAPARAEDGAARRSRRLDPRRARSMGGRVRERARDRARDRGGARARPRDARLHGQRAGADARARSARRRRDLH